MDRREAERLIELGQATPRQAEILRAIAENGSQKKAAKAVGTAQQNVSRALRTVRKRAALAGYAPEHDMTRTVPDGFGVKGVSTYYDADGNPRGQWVKSQADARRQFEIFRDALDDLVENIGDAAPAPRKRTEAPDADAADLLSVYPWGDPHVGLYAWAREAGDNHDLKIAERDLAETVDMVTARTPNSAVGLLANVGDFFHSDTMDNRTSRSGHALDVDGRFAKVLAVGERIMIRAINRMLEKHDRVIVRNAPGNHDDHTSIFLSRVLNAWFRNEPRVEISTSPAICWYYRHGATFLGVTHGHTIKMPELGAVMAAERPRDWGESEFRHWLTGHIHHLDKVAQAAKEYRGWTGESFRILAGRDAWSASKGFVSARDQVSITYSKQWGEQFRATVPLSKVRAMRDAA